VIPQEVFLKYWHRPYTAEEPRRLFTAQLFALYSDPEVRRYFPEGTLTCEETKEERDPFCYIQEIMFLSSLQSADRLLVFLGPG
jgi:hypothetical protein